MTTESPTPQMQAGRINERFYFSLPNNGSFTGINNINARWAEAKRCALIAVDEIKRTMVAADMLDYWTQVQKEIEKL